MQKKTPQLRGSGSSCSRNLSRRSLSARARFDRLWASFLLWGCGEGLPCCSPVGLSAAVNTVAYFARIKAVNSSHSLAFIVDAYPILECRPNRHALWMQPAFFSPVLAFFSRNPDSRMEPNSIGMLHIFRASAPLKVNNRVVFLVTIHMVDFQARARRRRLPRQRRWLEPERKIVGSWCFLGGGLGQPFKIKGHRRAGELHEAVAHGAAECAHIAL